MSRINPSFSAFLFILILVLSACAPLQQYRTRYDACPNTTPVPSHDCEHHALQEYRPIRNAAEDQGYLLGFIEFDDQGMLFDRKQMDSVISKLYENAVEKDLLIVVFAHGWKHSAKPGDSNIETFRKVLQGLSEAENRLSRSNNEPARRVVGVYLGWRGGSLTVPVIENLTFWERKNTAQEVGHGGITEVLNRLERVKQDKDSMVQGGSRTRLVVVGHSFGGLAVYAALAQLLESRFVHTAGPNGIQSNAQGFGDLVVLINPAFEALQYGPLSDMATERGHYFDTQLPVLAVLTSEADYATKFAFPVGRRFSTFFEKEREMSRWNATTKQTETIDEEDANITAVGHFDAYKTHFLRAVAESPVKASPAAEGTGEATSVQALYRTFASWRLDHPGSKIQFDGSVLERTENSAGRNPYLMIRVDGKLIKDHNDITDQHVIEFLKKLILVSSQSPKTMEKTHSKAETLRPLDKP